VRVSFLSCGMGWVGGGGRKITAVYMFPYFVWLLSYRARHLDFLGDSVSMC
jgi:hypothetical protein